MSKWRSNFRAFAKSVGPLYWFIGLLRYLGFQARLKIEERRFRNTRTRFLPPPMLRYRVHRALDEASYIHAGKTIAPAIARCLQSHGVILRNLEILDFACGPGRLATELKQLTEDCRIFGSDIDHEAIAWAQQNLPHIGTFTTNNPLPPTDFPNDFFDVIVSISLLTHVDEGSQHRWLKEWNRILKPGGTILTTVHGEPTYQNCTADELVELAERGIAHRVDRKGRFKLDGLPDFYQTTFHTRKYVKQAWGKWFDVIDHLDGGLSGHQDFVVLRRSPHPA